jgi:hypothetical protein
LIVQYGKKGPRGRRIASDSDISKSARNDYEKDTTAPKFIATVKDISPGWKELNDALKTALDKCKKAKKCCEEVGLNVIMYGHGARNGGFEFPVSGDPDAEIQVVLEDAGYTHPIYKKAVAGGKNYADTLKDNNVKKVDYRGCYTAGKSDGNYKQLQDHANKTGAQTTGYPDLYAHPGGTEKAPIIKTPAPPKK